MTLGRDPLPFVPLLVAALVAAPLAAGETESERHPPPVFTEQMSVTARAAAAVGTAVTVLDRAAIAEANVRSVAELVRWAAGVHVSGFGARGGSTSARVRGGDPNLTLVLLDGTPLNDPTDLEGGTFNLAGLPVAAVERVEIVRGPNSFFFGSRTSMRGGRSASPGCASPRATTCSPSTASLSTTARIPWGSLRESEDFPRPYDAHHSGMGRAPEDH